MIVVLDDTAVRFVIFQTNVEVGSQGGNGVAFENHRCGIRLGRANFFFHITADQAEMAFGMVG
jgi:hypothetical protein